MSPARSPRAFAARDDLTADVGAHNAHGQFGLRDAGLVALGRQQVQILNSTVQHVDGVQYPQRADFRHVHFHRAAQQILGRQPRGEQMPGILRTSSGVSGTSKPCLVFIETSRRADHPRGTRTVRGNHVLSSPLCGIRAISVLIRGSFERTWRKHHGNKPAVPDNVDTPERGNVFEKTPEVVLRVAGGYLL